MILSIPLGPRVDLTRSATAVAPTKESMRAFAPYVLRENKRVGTLLTTALSFKTAAYRMKRRKCVVLQPYLYN